MKLIPMLIAIAFVGSYIGKLILAKNSNVFFLDTVLLVIVATSIWQIFKMI
jgi:hypothetical protein